MKTYPRLFKMRALSRRILAAAALAAMGLNMFVTGPAWAMNPAAPPSLKTIHVPLPPNLSDFVKDRQMAIALGKALYWDMQVGSDGIMSCSTCHYHAGADDRIKGSLNPGLKDNDNTFQVVGPNGIITADMFPFHAFQDTNDRFTPVIRDANDVVSSPGIHNRTFVGLPEKGAAELGDVVPDSVFNVGGLNLRRVEPRNAPTVINAVFNFANFFDGRANNIFNGTSPFGESDPNAAVFTNVSGALKKVRVRIPMASLASQAVGPPVSDFEMSYAGRTFPDIGRKLLKAVPLAGQKVSKEDSVLGTMSRGKGLNTTYEAMVKAAFADKWWDSGQVVSYAGSDPVVVNDLGRKLTISAGKPSIRAKSATGALGAGEYSQMEANFSLFFGLAMLMYESTLVSDDTPFDRFQEGDDNAMSQSAKDGLNIFLTDAADPLNPGGSCIFCHGGPEFTNASVSHVGSTFFGTEVLPEGLIERMPMADGNGAFYDTGYYDIATRPIDEDPGRGGTDPFGWPLSFSERALLANNGTALPFENPPLPCGAGQPVPCPLQRTTVHGAFKVPTLRNVELTGPYNHNGGQTTLMQVIDFYVRGGDFNERNLATLSFEITKIVSLKDVDLAQLHLIDFLIALTDERVRYERAPFDHPEVYIPDGAPGDTAKVKGKNGQAKDKLFKVPAVGKNGRNKPIGTFMGLDPHVP